MRSENKDLMFLYVGIVLCVLALSLGAGCQSVRIRKNAGGISEEMSGLSAEKIDSIELTALFKCRVFFHGSEEKFSGLMAISAEKDARFEIISPVGSTSAVLIMTGEGISLFIPSEKIIYRGKSAADTLYKILGIGIEPSDMIDVLTGIAQYRAGTKNQNLSLSVAGSDQNEKVEVNTGYRRSGSGCESIVPSGVEVHVAGGLDRVEIFIERIDELRIYAGNRQLCDVGTRRAGSSGAEEERQSGIFSDAPFLNLPGIEVIDLDTSEDEKPFIQRVRSEGV